ncbi:hypothetical protein TSAR_006911 [Trichomalopsis sarcophagae]|uniref:Uncharacterized protein n=1 Tax=Trichomalopsis sarcophagae TaxID=543379 RepID=A0A232EFH0_9HYME|nr:hypothetical protein TSAR_006911 [Trichomalopsis sarcophagae]
MLVLFTITPSPKKDTYPPNTDRNLSFENHELEASGTKKLQADTQEEKFLSKTEKRFLKSSMSGKRGRLSETAKPELDFTRRQAIISYAASILSLETREDIEKNLKTILTDKCKHFLDVFYVSDV